LYGGARVEFRDDVRRVDHGIDGLAARGLEPAPLRILRAHPFDGAAVGHREQVRAQPAARRIERRGLFPEPHEHVLHHILGLGGEIPEHPDREAQHGRRVFAVDLAQRFFVTGDESLRPESVGRVLGHLRSTSRWPYGAATKGRIVRAGTGGEVDSTRRHRPMGRPVRRPMGTARPVRPRRDSMRDVLRSPVRNGSVFAESPDAL
jgi:hypothetical protein